MRRGCVVIAAVLAALVLPTEASASYYMSQQNAESTTREFLHYTLGYHYTAASCRPQGAPKAAAGYIYHRWVCGWVAGDSRSSFDCLGQSRVMGSSDSTSFYWLVLHHSGTCQDGWKVE